MEEKVEKTGGDCNNYLDELFSNDIDLTSGLVYHNYYQPLKLLACTILIHSKFKAEYVLHLVVGS